VRRLIWLTTAALLGCSTPPPISTVEAPVDSAAPDDTAAGLLPPELQVAPPPPFEARKIALEQGAMGTKITLMAFTTPLLDETEIKAALLSAFAEFQRLEAVMTTWREDSEVSRINQAAGNQPVKVGPDTFAVIDKSLWIAEKSSGVFDISFDAMRGLWNFDEAKGDEIPDKAAIAKARKLIDYRKISIDRPAATVKLDKPGMRINLGGIAKGYAVDAAAKKLDDAKITAFFVQAGGDLFVRGKKPDGTSFHVGVRDPRGSGPSDAFATVDVSDHAFSTAGDYERAFVKDGKRYHHIIDPRTGYPATACRSVTIWAKDAFTADAIDDAVFILGPEKGLALVESLDGVGAVIVDKDNRVWVSPRLEGKVTVFRPPTNAP
jgi:thiamine biosynthesis lipoprotein